MLLRAIAVFPRSVGRSVRWCAGTSAKPSIQQLTEALKQSEARISELKEKLEIADNDALQAAKRYTQDLDNSSKYAIVSMAKDLLLIHDNMKRAIGCLAEEDKTHSKDIRDILKALSHTENLLTEAFEAVGIEETNPLGEAFNPNFHEAMFEFPNPERKTGEVGHIISTGFTIHERVLRAAKVGVTKN